MRRILEGIRAALHESGLNRRYLHSAMRCYCALHNFVDVWKLDKTLYELRFNKKFEGQRTLEKLYGTKHLLRHHCLAFTGQLVI